MPIGAGLDKLKSYLEENKPRHIERIQRLIRQPSVSTEDLGVEECAELLVEQHLEAGCQEAEIIPTGGLPGVWAAYDAGAPKTIIVYANFDTRPVLPSEKWEHPPFGGTLTTMGSTGRVLMGRGAMSYKGPYGAWLNTLEALIAVEGTLPVNVMMLLEGDEILGSPYYRDMFAKYRDRLEKADASLSPGASQGANGTVGMTLGYKGMIYAELTASGDRWGRGPQGAPLHGMTKSVVDSPVWRLVHALSTLTEPDGNTIAVKGFYDDVQAPTEEEKAAVLSGKPWNQALAGVAGAPVPAGDLERRADYSELLLRAEPEHQRHSGRVHRAGNAALQSAPRGLGAVRHSGTSRIQGADGGEAYPGASGRCGIRGRGVQRHGGL